MKKIKIWSMMLLAAMVLPMMVACGGDEEDGFSDEYINDGTASTYTSSEVFKLLKGKWGVSGNCSVTYSDNEHENINEDYSGVLEFLVFNDVPTGKYWYKFQVDKGSPYFVTGEYGDDYDKGRTYGLTKKNEKYYIVFKRKFYLEILSLTNTSLKLLIDQELYNSEDKVIGHIRMTMNGYATH